VSCVSLSYFYSSLDLLSARRSCRRWSRVVLDSDKSLVFGPKALSSRFMIFRRLQQLISMRSKSSNIFSHLLLLQRLYLCLLLLEREYSVIFI